MHLALDEHLRLCIRAETETSSDALLAQLCLSRKDAYLHYAGRRISCNGRLLAQDHPLHAGDTLIIDPIMPEETITPWDHPVDVLHEDELFAIINKESGRLVHSDGQQYRAHGMQRAPSSFHPERSAPCAGTPAASPGCGHPAASCSSANIRCFSHCLTR